MARKRKGPGPSKRKRNHNYASRGLRYHPKRVAKGLRSTSGSKRARGFIQGA